MTLHANALSKLRTTCVHRTPSIGNPGRRHYWDSLTHFPRDPSGLHPLLLQPLIQLQGGTRRHPLTLCPLCLRWARTIQEILKAWRRHSYFRDRLVLLNDGGPPLGLAP